LHLPNLISIKVSVNSRVAFSCLVQHKMGLMFGKEKIVKNVTPLQSMF